MEWFCVFGYDGLKGRHSGLQRSKMEAFLKQRADSDQSERARDTGPRRPVVNQAELQTSERVQKVNHRSTNRARQK